MRRSDSQVLGVDAAGRNGWVGVLVDDDGFAGAHLGSLEKLVEWAGPVAVIGIDIPIGNAPDGGRRADSEARRAIGPRGSSVFAAPPPAALTAHSYRDANDALEERGLSKLSRQTWALIPKINEAAALVEVDPRVFEVHPEVSFREMAGEALQWSKKSWNGLLLRRRLLAGEGIVLPDVVEDVRDAVADDVVDAAAAAWSARRIAAGTARTYPDPPEELDGRSVAIWC